MSDAVQKKFSLLRALVVDDVSTARWASRHMLTEMGFLNVEEAQSGRAALERLRQLPFNLILCDWNMGDMNGLELFEALAGDSNLKRIPFVMVTGSVTAEKVKEAVQKGIHSYVAKPISEDTLRKAIAQAFTRVAKLSP